MLLPCIIPDFRNTGSYVRRGGAGHRVVAQPAGGGSARDRDRFGDGAMGLAIGMPLCRPLGQGLWEVRSALPSRRIARLLFFVHEDRIGVVHGFIKKTQKTPADDLELARRRMKEMQE